MTASKYQKVETCSQQSHITFNKYDRPQRTLREDFKEDTELEDATESKINVTEASQLGEYIPMIGALTIMERHEKI